MENDLFDRLCMSIREARHYSRKFIFEYEDGKRKKLFYDSQNNTVEYTKEGIEHYESLIFYETPDFSDESYDKLDDGLKGESRVFLTRQTIPQGIWYVDRRGSMQSIL